MRKFRLCGPPSIAPDSRIFDCHRSFTFTVAAGLAIFAMVVAPCRDFVARAGGSTQDVARSQLQAVHFPSKK
jgi:hypothetical protein